MSTPQQKMAAFESIKKFAVQFPGIFEVFEDWAKVGSVEQAGDEVQAKLDDIKAKAAKAQALHVEALNGYEVAYGIKNHELNQLIDQRHAEADDIIAKANAAAQAVKDDAEQHRAAMTADVDALLERTRQDVAKMLQQAGTDADGIKAAATADIDKTRAAAAAATADYQKQAERALAILTDIKNNIAGSSGTLTDLNQKVSAKTDEYDKIAAAVSDLKSRLGL